MPKKQAGRKAVREAYRDAWHAVALARAEDLMKDPALRRSIDESILKVLRAMVARLEREQQV
jgi:hypothetical protein